MGHLSRRYRRLCPCGVYARTDLTYCSHCGLDYEGQMIKDIFKFIWAKLTRQTKFTDDVAAMTYLTKRIRKLLKKRGVAVDLAIATTLIVACELIKEAGGARADVVTHARTTWDNAIRPREMEQAALRGEAAAGDNRKGRRKLKAIEGGKR